MTGTIWLDDVKCSGSESRLISCLANILGSHNCRHSEDVAIECRDTLGTPTIDELLLHCTNNLSVCLSICHFVYSVINFKASILTVLAAG